MILRFSCAPNGAGPGSIRFPRRSAAGGEAANRAFRIRSNGVFGADATTLAEVLLHGEFAINTGSAPFHVFVDTA